MEQNSPIQKLMAPVIEGDADALEQLNRIVVETVKEQFEQLFLPGRCMRGEGAFTDANAPTITIATTVRMRPSEDDLVEPAEVFLEKRYNQALQDVLVSAEELVWRRLSFHTADDIKTPQDLWAFIRPFEQLPRYLIVGGHFLRNVFLEKQRHEKPNDVYFVPAEKAEQFTAGRFGRVLNFLDIYTDVFRYDTLRVLPNDAICCVAAEPSCQVRWAWNETPRGNDAIELELVLHLS